MSTRECTSCMAEIDVSDLEALADDLAAVLAAIIDDQDYEVSPEGASASGQVLARYREARGL